MKDLLRTAREKKNLKTRELAQLLGIDQALVSKFESGNRKPTRVQVVKLASVLEIDFETLMVAWLKEKILYEIGDDTNFGIKAMKVAKSEMKYELTPQKRELSPSLMEILNEIDSLKKAISRAIS